MLVSKFALVRWNGYTRKHYESNGYEWTKQNDYFECEIKDLMTTSTARVEVKCDYCNEGVSNKEYRQYINERKIVSKDCCNNRKCMVQKSEEVNILKYGVKTYAQTKESRESNRSLFQTPLNEVDNFCKEKGLSILNLKDYQNDRTRLFFTCSHHLEKGIQETNFANVKQNKTCCFYGGVDATANGRRNDGKEVVDAFLREGLIPKFNVDDYQNNYQPLPFICPNHIEKGVQYRAYTNLKYAVGCLFCSDERTGLKLRTPQDEVFSYFISRGLKPLRNQAYRNKDTHIKFRCVKHNDYIQETTYYNLQSVKVPCKYCRDENTITKLNKKLRSVLGEWKGQSEIACAFKCVLTGSSKYEIHHLYSYNSIIKEALAKLNIGIKENYTHDEIKSIKDAVLKLHFTYPLGVCIAKNLHKLFHKLYSKNNNTPEQFEEFKLRYLMGEFKSILNERSELHCKVDQKENPIN